MRIISNFRDYYDSLMAYDSDRDIIYKRIEVIKENYAYKSSISYNGIDIYPICVGFCGEIYSGVSIKYRIKYYPDNKLISYYVYGREKVLELVNHIPEDVICPQYSYKTNDKYHRKNIIRMIDESFDDRGMSGIFVEYNCPIFVMKSARNWKDNGKLLINTNIGIYEFQKVLDPYTSYQKLKSYIEGIAQPIRPIPKLNDKVMQEIKGFDHKYSFRKEPKNLC